MTLIYLFFDSIACLIDNSKSHHNSLTMTKINSVLSQKSNVPPDVVGAVLSALREAAIESLKVGEPLRITNFLVFDSELLPQRKRRNPKTQKEIIVPAGRKALFNYSPNFLKEIQTVNEEESSKPAFELPPVPADLIKPAPDPVPEKVYYLQGGGSFSFSELKKKQLDPDTPVYTEEDGWKTYAQLSNS